MSCDFPDLGDWGGSRPAEVEEVAAERAEALAWSSMLGLTAGQVTLCPVVVRPNSSTTSTTTSTTSTTSTAAADTTMATLERPVGKVVEVRLSGVVLDPSKYRVEGNQLRRLDGDGWPTTTDMTLPLGEGEFEVTYYRGRRPGPAFIWAVGQLAAELYLAMHPERNGKKCRLPDSVTAVVRQGVTYEVNPGIFANGLTGVKEIDAVLRQYNPNALRQPTLVMSVDSIANAPIQVG